MRKLQMILGHVNLSFGVLFLVLWVINIFNPKMQFLASGVTNVFLVLFCISAIALSIVSIILYRRFVAFQHDRAVAAARARRMGQHPQRPSLRQ